MKERPPGWWVQAVRTHVGNCLKGGGVNKRVIAEVDRLLAATAEDTPPPFEDVEHYDCDRCSGNGGMLMPVGEGDEAEMVEATCPDCGGAGRFPFPTDREMLERLVEAVEDEPHEAPEYTSPKTIGALAIAQAHLTRTPSETVRPELLKGSPEWYIEGLELLKRWAELMHDKGMKMDAGQVFLDCKSYLDYEPLKNNLVSTPEMPGSYWAVVSKALHFLGDYFEEPAADPAKFKTNAQTARLAVKRAKDGEAALAELARNLLHRAPVEEPDWWYSAAKEAWDLVSDNRDMGRAADILAELVLKHDGAWEPGPSPELVAGRPPVSPPPLLLMEVGEALAAIDRTGIHDRGGEVDFDSGGDLGGALEARVILSRIRDQLQGDRE